MAVMYLGRIVEYGIAEQVLSSPLHPYTQALISAVPEIDPEKKRQRIVLAGDPPNPEDIPPGCPFHPRCQFAMATCSETPPALKVAQGRVIACHLY